jgi:NADP-dependent 3-hydroxy acid dehydrogenase YdfG
VIRGNITDDDWLNIFEVNVLNGVRLNLQYLPAMLKQNWEHIIFILSQFAVQIPV